MMRAAIHGIRYGLALLLLSTPFGVHALGLGEARVDSFLNQPLDVRMRLLDASELDLDSLTVAPASPDDFDRLGVSSRALALDLEVEIDGTVNPPVVRIVSRRPVTDPVVQLIVDARWSGGRMLREYTLFLDPPTVDIAPPPAPAVAEPESEPSERSAPAPSSSSPRPAAPPAEPAARARSASPRGDGSNRYGPVASGETLWSIARDSLPAGDVTMDQMMIAIVELNPSAFRDNNINRLLRGARLELPDAERARAMDATEAAALVAAQMRAFNRGETGSNDLPRVSDAARDVDSTGDSTQAATADEAGQDSGETGDGSEAAQPRLSLVPPGDDEVGGAAGDGSSVDALRQRLARAEEELYAARQEAEEFESRVEELEQLVRDNPGGLGLMDADLAGLEETLRAAREATRDGADPEMRAEVSAQLGDFLERMGEGDVDDSMVDSSNADGSDSVPDSVETDRSLAAESASETGSADEPPAASEANDSEGDQAGDSGVTEVERSGGLPSWLPLAAGVVVLLIIVAVVARVLQRRRQGAEHTPAVRGEEPKVSPSPDVDVTETDPIIAARAHLADAPDDLDRHVELLELLAADRREDEFSAALEAMFEHVDSGSEPQWRQALRLAGGIVPGHLLVKGSADWVADTSGDRTESSSELDEDAEVDDLMARLEADDDDSEAERLGADSDEEEWPDFDEDSDKTEGGSASDQALDFDSMRSAPGDAEAPQSEPGDVEREAGFDEDETPAEDSGGLEFESPSLDLPARDEADAGLEAESDMASDLDADTGESKPAPADEEYDSPTLEWPEFGEYAGDEALGGNSDDDSDDSGEAQETASEAETDSDESGEIFGQSDDDIDVKLDLARAYLSWDSADSARTLLEEVLREGNDSQREQAQKLLDELPGESDS